MDERVLTPQGRLELVAELRDELTHGPQPTHDTAPDEVTTADLLRIVGAPIIDPERWPLFAACATAPETTSPSTEAQARGALERCAQCPVLAECRTWLDDEPAFEGIAGGAWVRPRAKNPRVTLADLTREDIAA
ncbi:WhiB family transcriptional regulator [Oerskovia merdavium]|uniref:WhiB family transcriptional regulator n=1 Tax=Oerskovia merdavium TaxID=2762227 RepID=A0ABR8U406_9CELL|nr:WhiB family transcriptional regulator [Oerskovia merdavium]MBD7982760.1 WhiB family transcriptional regulator [Oerskovia merdavium]